MVFQTQIKIHLGMECRGRTLSACMSSFGFKLAGNPLCSPSFLTRIHDLYLSTLSTIYRRSPSPGVPVRHCHASNSPSWPLPHPAPPRCFEVLKKIQFGATVITRAAEQSEPFKLSALLNCTRGRSLTLGGIGCAKTCRVGNDGDGGDLPVRESDGG